MHKIKGYKDEWRIQEYLLITFFISWLSWGILILLTALNITKFADPLSMVFFIIGGFGPTISAIMCIDGKINPKKILNFIFEHKSKALIYFLLFVILECAVIMLSTSSTNPATPIYALPIVFIVSSLFGGGNEELGWRGTMQPLLERVLGQKIKNPILNFVVTVLLIGVVWALWHLPLWFVNGSPQQALPFFWFALDALIQSIILGSLYHRTGSVFYCMLLHGLINTLLGFFVVEINWILILGYLIVTILAILIAVLPEIKKPKSKVTS